MALLQKKWRQWWWVKCGSSASSHAEFKAVLVFSIGITHKTSRLHSQRLWVFSLPLAPRGTPLPFLEEYERPGWILLLEDLDRDRLRGCIRAP